MIEQIVLILLLWLEEKGMKFALQCALSSL